MALRFTVVGFRFVGETPQSLKNGKITLEPEPTNPYDSNAIRVLVNGKAVGHVAREDCKYMKDNISADISVIETYSASAVCRCVPVSKNEILNA